MNASARMGAREWGLLLALSALWGGSFFFFKVLVAVWPLFTIVLGRVGVAAVALNVYIRLSGGAMPGDARLWARFFGMGLLNNVLPFSLIVFGETRISSGLASILNATTPIFGVLAAQLLTADERLTPARALGVGFGFLGVAVLVGPSALQGGGDLAGELSCLTAALVYALAGIYGRRFRGVPALQVATGQVTASTLMLLPLVALHDQPWTLPAPGPEAWGALAALALLCTALAYILYFRLLALAGATNLLLVTFLLPASALALGALFLHETIEPRALLGVGIIGLGLAAIDGRLLRLGRRR